MSTWLVTGASRGIGLELVRQIAAGGDTVFATARSPASAPALQQLHDDSPPGRIHIVSLDVADAQSIQAAARAVGDILQSRGLDYLVNNAARGGGGDIPSTVDPQVMLSVFQTNVVGPALVFQAFLPALDRSTRPEGPVVLNTTSGLSSISPKTDATRTSYAISKSALNMLTVKQSAERPNIIVFAMKPGWVKTDMGGKGAEIDVSYSVSHQYKVITTATRKDSGTFKRYDGENVPW